MSRTPPRYFEQLYDRDPDPWGFATNWYEQRKYALTVASLPLERYRSAFEPGCSIGALTEHLAPRCDHILAVDQMAEPLATAALRLRHLTQVTFEQRVIPDHWPEGPFDLLVLSEVCYYFDAGELRGLIDRARRSIAAGATVVAVHWSEPTDYPLTALQAHRALGSIPTFEPVAHHVDERFLLDVWRNRP